MRIGFDAKRLFFNATGLGNYSRSLVSSLAHHFPKHEYLLYTPKFPGSLSFQQQPDMVTFYPMGLPSLLPALWRTYGLANQLKSDAIDIYHGLSHELPRGIENTGVKSVVTIHDVIFKKYPEQYAAIDRWIYDRKVAHACRVADCIVAISEQTKRDIIKYYGVEEEKIKVVYQSCDRVFSEAIDEEKQQTLISHFALPERYVLYVGSLVERKNILNLLRAFQLINDPGLHLLLVGNGSSYKKKVIQFINENGLEKRVRVISFATNNELPTLYRNASLFVYPSLYEGFGIPIIEALSSGVPVIATQGGCFPEAGGPETVYVDTNDVKLLSEAIAFVLSDQILKRKMIAAGLNYVERFSPEKIADNMMGVYEGLVK